MTHAGVISELVRGYAQARGVAATTASRILAGNGDTLARLERGAALSPERAVSIATRAEQLWSGTDRRALERALRALELLATAERAADEARARVLGAHNPQEAA